MNAGTVLLSAAFLKANSQGFADQGILSGTREPYPPDVLKRVACG